jgi:hypothetical protein
MDLFQAAPRKTVSYEIIAYSEFKKLYDEFKPEPLYGKYCMTEARIGMAAFNKAIEWGILVPYGSEYCLNEKIKL